MSRVPQADVHAEAVELLDAAEAEGIPLRALGGTAVKMLCPSASQPPLQREYKDIDLVGLSAERGRIEAFLAAQGYAPDSEFNLLNGDTRLYFWDTANGRQMDVFLDRLEMCHTLELESRLSLAPRTLAPTDLLMTKLQVVETNERDLKDAAALLLDCDVDHDRVAEMLAGDWPWWRTVTLVLERLEAYSRQVEFDRSPELRDRVRELSARIEAEPKSRRWKLRARIGERKRWYELPEEDHVEG